MKKIYFAPILLFFLAIWFPAFQMSFGIYKEFDDTENRELAPVPRWTESSPSKLVREVEAYVDDHFGFRPDLIRWNSFMRVNLLGASPVGSVIIGRDSWLFYCSEALDDGNSINDFMGMIPLAESELEKLRLRLEDNNKKFAAKGIRYIVAITPNKNTIYSEHLPEKIESSRAPKTRLDQFFDYFSKAGKSDLVVLDLRGALSAAKTRFPVYWETDSHWNSYGAYVGYREIFRQIARYFPNSAPLEIRGKVAVHRGSRGGDLAKMLFLTDLIGENNNTEFKLSRCRPQFRKLVFRHDSFGDGLYPFLTKHFQIIANIAPFAPFRFEEIFRDPPEIVLHVFTERYLTQAIHDDFGYHDERQN